jgi:hypothetical protein
MSYLYPEFGFGNGFDRYYCTSNQRHYLRQFKDLRKDTSTIINWIDEDINAKYDNVFYFWHIFPPHAPYIPPALDRRSSIDLTDRYRKDIKGKYLKNLNRKSRSKDDEFEKIIQRYNSSAEFVAKQISRLINQLRYYNIFDESLIIIIGDHGEEFGERGFYGHNSLYDANIRPFMLVKPPIDASWQVRDEIDYIDIFPTICESVGISIPDQCEGIPLQAGEIQQPRITERIQPDYYNISVEIDDIKGIFTYEENFPHRPGKEMIGQPICEEYYSIQSVRSGNFEDIGEKASEDIKYELKQTAENFIIKRFESEENDSIPISTNTKEQLKDLGYMN